MGRGDGGAYKREENGGRKGDDRAGRSGDKIIDGRLRHAAASAPHPEFQQFPKDRERIKPRTKSFDVLVTPHSLPSHANGSLE